MRSACDDSVRDTLISVLASMDGALLAMDDRGAIRGVLPEEGPFPGMAQGQLLGRTAISALKADFVRVFDGKDSWDEIGYFVDGTGERRPYHVRRFEGRGHPFAPLFPGATSFILASPISAYGSLESMHEQSLANHARELEAMNRTLVARTRKLKEAMAVLEARNRQNIKEMNLAVELQKSLLPKSYPDTDLVSFTHRYIPMAMVGGDFFDIVKLSEDRIGVMISDVSGHGVAPAFITAMIRSSFDYLVTPDRPPSEVIGLLNGEFAKIIDTDHFVTAFYAVFDFATMTCRYCNAGHPPQILAHADGSFAELAPTNPIIGMMDQFDFHDDELPFRYGDVLCFYTDGVIEARDSSDALFGTEGIKRSIASAMSESLDGMADGLITDLIQFMKDPYFEDDITILFGQVIESL